MRSGPVRWGGRERPAWCGRPALGTEGPWNTEGSTPPRVCWVLVCGCCFIKCLWAVLLQLLAGHMLGMPRVLGFRV